jgi:hypothetical protein
MQNPTARSGDTYCISCTVNVSDVSIINSVAYQTARKRCAAFRLLQRLCRAHDCFVFLCCNGCRIDLHAQKEAAPTELLYEQCSALSALCVCD